MTMLKKKKSNVVPMITQDEICKLARQYAEISANIKQLEEVKKELADKIKKGAEQYGEKDDKGSFYLEDDSYIMGKVARKSFKIDQDKAVKTLEAMGLSDVLDIVTVKTVNEDKLQRAVGEERISLDTISDFTNESVSYSVLVKEKEDVPEAEQTNFKVARRKK